MVRSRNKTGIGAKLSPDVQDYFDVSKGGRVTALTGWRSPESKTA
jgi:hypothetical protein